MPVLEHIRSCRAWLMQVRVPVPSFDASWEEIASVSSPPRSNDADCALGQTTIAACVVTCYPSGWSPISHRYAARHHPRPGRSHPALTKTNPPPLSVPARVTAPANIPRSGGNPLPRQSRASNAQWVVCRRWAVRLLALRSDVPAHPHHSLVMAYLSFPSSSRPLSLPSSCYCLLLPLLFSPRLPERNTSSRISHYSPTEHTSPATSPASSTRLRPTRTTYPIAIDPALLSLQKLTYSASQHLLAQ